MSDFDSNARILQAIREVIHDEDDEDHDGPLRVAGQLRVGKAIVELVEGSGLRGDDRIMALIFGVIGLLHLDPARRKWEVDGLINSLSMRALGEGEGDDPDQDHRDFLRYRAMVIDDGQWE